jgi:hypothetical protein
MTSIHTDVCRGCGVTDMPGVGSEHLAPHVAHGSDRRSVFSTTVTRLPKLHGNEQRAWPPRRVLPLPMHFLSALSPDVSVGRSTMLAARHPLWNRAGVVFCGAQDFRTLHGCRRFRASA